MRQAITTIVAVSCLSIAGCSKSSDEIAGVYVSPFEFQSYDCDQLTQEAGRVGRKVRELSGIQDQEASDDTVAVGVGIILWPALIFLGDSDREAELAQLKGELEAMEQVAFQKNCTSLLERLQKGREAAEKQEET